MARRWGFSGYGWVARDFMRPAIDASGDILVAIADPSEAARRRAEADGVAAFATLDAMLQRAGCDILYVATPNHRHAEAVRGIAGYGLPVLCEKPMAATLADAETIAATVAASGIVYGTAFDQRHHPAHAAMRQQIRAGAIGKPVAVRIVYGCWVGPQWSPTGTDNWRADPKAAGGGAVIDLSLHGLDLVQFLLGEPISRLHIMLQRRIHAYAVDDGGVLTGRTADGVLVSSHVAYNTPEKLPRRRLEVLGAAGLLVATDTMGQTAGGSVTLQQGDTVANVPFDTERSPFAAQAQAFADATLGRPHDFSVERDIGLMRLFDAAYQEARRCL